MLPLLSTLLALPLVALAATADQWRTRSIYQVIVDRFALPANSGISPSACNPGAQTWCGGTWASVQANLDYIQKMGFDAIWISPVNQNIPGGTAYGDPYHGYWIADITQLNPKFGTAQDLLNLSNELHRRGMYLMVDVVVNNVAATSITPDYSQYLFKDASLYHPYCPIDFTNTTSIQQCWLGDTKVALPDVNTEDPTVISTYNSWVAPFVQQFQIDGLRIDAARHVRPAFWGGFCNAAGVFCIGEDFDTDISACAAYQDPSSLDSVLNFPQYGALTAAFGIPGPGNMSALVSEFQLARQLFKDVTVLGNFMENQDLPRWANISVDPQSEWNALVFSFMSDGIPIVYYGQEQRFHGASDPWNREPLWPSNYQDTATLEYITMLNTLRNYLIKTSDWATEPAQIISYTKSTVFLAKGYVISVMTNIGSPPSNTSAVMEGSGFSSGQLMIDVVTCQQVVVGSKGSINIDYTKGGRAAILVPEPYLRGSTLCMAAQKASVANVGPATASSAIGRIAPGSRSSLLTLAFAAVLASVTAVTFGGL